MRKRSLKLVVVAFQISGKIKFKKAKVAKTIKAKFIERI